jgi:hypothetical protein
MSFQFIPPQAAACSPPPCGEGSGVGVLLFVFDSYIPPCPSPNERAFTPVFDGLWGEGTQEPHLSEHV